MSVLHLLILTSLNALKTSLFLVFHQEKGYPLMKVFPKLKWEQEKEYLKVLTHKTAYDCTLMAVN